MIRTKQENEVGARKFANVDELLAYHEGERRALARLMYEEHARLNEERQPDAREELGSDPRKVRPVVTPDRVAVMLDIETLGQVAGCVVTDVAVVVFDPVSGDVYEERSWVLDHHKLREFYGKNVDPVTFEWRIAQGWEPPVDVREPHSVCVELGTFFLEVATRHGLALNEILIYAWRYSLDKTSLDDLFEGCGVAVPWQFYQWWCAASVCHAAGVKRSGRTSHVAVEDCRRQVDALVRALTIIDGRLKPCYETKGRVLEAIRTGEEAWPMGVRRGDRFELADGFLTVTDYDGATEMFVGLRDDGELAWMSPRMVSSDLSKQEGRGE